MMYYISYEAPPSWAEAHVSSAQHPHYQQILWPADFGQSESAVAGRKRLLRVRTVLSKQLEDNLLQNWQDRWGNRFQTHWKRTIPPQKLELVHQQHLGSGRHNSQPHPQRTRSLQKMIIADTLPQFHHHLWLSHPYYYSSMESRNNLNAIINFHRHRSTRIAFPPRFSHSPSPSGRTHLLALWIGLWFYFRSACTRWTLNRIITQWIKGWSLRSASLKQRWIRIRWIIGKTKVADKKVGKRDCRVVTKNQNYWGRTKKQVFFKFSANRKNEPWRVTSIQI